MRFSPAWPEAVGQAVRRAGVDEKLLADLSPGIDPCGEQGEFHSFCYRCTEFRTDIPMAADDVVKRNGSWFADLRPTVTGCGVPPG